MLAETFQRAQVQKYSAALLNSFDQLLYWHANILLGVMLTVLYA